MQERDPSSSDHHKKIVVRVGLLNGYDVDVKVRLALTIRTQNEIGLVSCDSALKGELYVLPRLSESSVTCEIFSSPLNAGEYLVNIAVFKNGLEPEDWITSACGFSVEHEGFDGNMNTNPFPILCRFRWRVH